MSDEAQVNVFAGEVRDALGPVDILVNNAAIVPVADFDNATFEYWQRTFAINADGPFLTVKAFLGNLKHSDAGRVVNMTAAAYWTTPPPFVAYASSKRALNGLTHVSEEFFDQTVQTQDLKRRGKPEDIANTVAFLASDEAAFITGQIIVVDAGITRR